MRETSARLLRLLSLLQMRREWSGADLAERLDVTPRTVRRDVDKLRDLGYPVNASVGVGGGYQLGAGAEMPPLLLDDEEALAVAFGLQSGATGSVEGLGDSSLRALTKLRQVMPSRLRHRLDALRIDVVPQGAPRSAVDAKVLSAIASLCHVHERLRFDYRTNDGTESRREVEPHRLVRAGARWYLVAWDLTREDWRSFRVDRMTPKTPSGPRFTPRELPTGDAAAFVSSGISRALSQVTARVLLDAPIEQIAPMVDEYWGALESADGDRCVIELRGESAAGIAGWLTAFGVDFTVLDPPELREECLQRAEHHAMLSERYRRS
ncbi:MULTISPECIES: YafY family protein [Rhodococcus]|jgi:predicted DNA-binding transcriptional regulator YafY|uniref:helix-turn-helix transcriptional regulator n=1 Tax=Rhodococcus TaxID=1827 RepID=UPI000BD5BE4C|nr:MULTISPECIES: YafY family protein [Rhodococcus]MBP1160269.1 putative DNA-binding transcriptional regulator YafY [Rhodococcus sp. PvR099]MCZ4557274.1 YafY family protein [Rhodococcus maanshanensis]PTR42865.1 putative DNA-binding transcriptional regulator YafY [Rhodococcus sp. OK611]SNX91778.1 Predicted DNA-binding transcriptional regulator YafY, contains an HTH and WYL domains [Rhodococcus sp. OK270]